MQPYKMVDAKVPNEKNCRRRSKIQAPNNAFLWRHYQTLKFIPFELLIEKNVKLFINW